MTRSRLWFPVLALSLSACAGQLENPEQYETGQGAASAADSGTAADTDAGANGGGNGSANTGGNGSASECGSTVELLKTKCGNAGCHGAASPAAKLDLASEGVATRLKDAPASSACSGYSQINSTDPSKSLIYLKVTDTPPCEPRMPIGAPLSNEEQACLLAWLEQL